jgi:hypothetical protein
MNVSVVARKGLDEDTLALVQRLVAMIPWPFDRQAKADVAATLLDGRLRLAEKVFGWGRESLKVGVQELRTGIVCEGDTSTRRKPRAEERLPDLQRDIHELFDSQSQADSRLGTTLRYLNASAAAVREALVSKGYAEAELPSVRTISNLLNRMGYRLRTVIKAKPQKKRQKQT